LCHPHLCRQQVLLLRGFLFPDGFCFLQESLLVRSAELFRWFFLFVAILILALRERNFKRAGMKTRPYIHENPR
jgi:hypothetical protein